MGHETRAINNLTGGYLSFGLMSPNLRFLVFERHRVGEQMISAYVVPTMKHGGVMMWGGLLMTLSVIYLEFKAHLTSMATTAFCSETPSHLVWA